MINRVLIRTKVVQLLYSYLLTEKQFMIESQPSAPTKEKRFAYSLYLDFLMLMLKTAERVKLKNGSAPLMKTRFILKLKGDDTIVLMAAKYRQEPFPFESIVDGLTEKIMESETYVKFMEGKGTRNTDDMLWEDLFNRVIITYPPLLRLIEQRQNYTLGGMERMKEMMNVTFTNFYTTRDNITDALSTLRFSLEKARELYMRLLLLPLELTWVREQQIDDNRHKFLPSEEDRNPNTRFIDNKLVKLLKENRELNDYLEEKKVSWLMEDRRFVDRLLKEIMNSPVYKQYMEGPAPGFHEDCEFWRDLYKHVIFDSEIFLEDLEDKSVFWNDDLEIIGTFLLKTLKKFEDETEGNPILPMYKDEEDAQFGSQLFTLVMTDKDIYRDYINRFVVAEKWDSERLAFMDVVITMTALAELLNFPKIPLVVTYNEYIEIAKNYSSSKSASFVNGILRSIVEELRKEGKIMK